MEGCDAIAVRNATVLFFFAEDAFSVSPQQRVCGSSSLYHTRTADDGVLHENASERKRSDIELHLDNTDQNIVWDEGHRASVSRSLRLLLPLVHHLLLLLLLNDPLALSDGAIRSTRLLASADEAAATVKALTCARRE